MTYRELLDILKALTLEQLDMTVQTYSGDIDDTITVIETSENSDEEMGKSIENFQQNQLFLILE